MKITNTADAQPQPEPQFIPAAIPEFDPLNPPSDFEWTMEREDHPYECWENWYLLAYRMTPPNEE